MKRLLSWIVLFLVSCVVAISFQLVIWIGVIGLILINNLGIASFFLGVDMALLPFSLGVLVVIFGSTLTVQASESICPTKAGYRYIIYSILLLIQYIILFVKNLDIFAILMCLYAIGLLIRSRYAKD